MGVTTTSSAYILKTLWPQKRVENTVYQDHPLLAMIPKSEEFYGANMVLAVRYADTQGRAATFSTAQANKGSHAGVKFTITRVSDYQLVSLTTEAILAAQNDKGALIRNLDTEMSSGMNNIGASLAHALYGDGSGSLGALASDPGTGTSLTLANINNITNFEVGQRIVFAANATSALRAGGARTISAINRDTGVITISAACDAAVGSSDLIFTEGDYVSASDRLKVSGLAAWIPSTAPSASESFFGVDRSVDATRLAGLRIDLTGLNPEEGVMTALSKLAREGGKPGHLFVNHLDYRGIEISLGSKVVTEYMSVGDVGFSGLKLVGPKGPVRVVADQDCPSGTGYLLTMDSLKLYSLKACPQVLDMDGDRLSRETTSDGWEARIAYYAQMGSTFPGANAVLTMP